MKLVWISKTRLTTAFPRRTMLKSISEIAPYVSFGKSKTTQLLKAMGDKGVVTVEGKGRGTKYIIR